MRLPIQGGAVLIVLMLAACGSSGEVDAQKGVDAAGQNAPEGGQAPLQSATGEAADSPGTAQGGTGMGAVQIGDDVYDFTISRCQSLGGALGGGGESVDDPENVDVTFEFQPEDWKERDASEGWTDMASIRLDSQDPYLSWQAGSAALQDLNLPAGITTQDSAITSFDISDDGQTVTGTAQFVEINALFAGAVPEIRAGTFSFSCPPKV